MEAELNALEYESKIGVSCKERVRRVFVPVHVKETIHRNGDSITRIVVSPESFLVLFYLYFWSFVFLAMIVSSVAGNIDYDNNPIMDTYGENNICLVFDYPPVIYFAATVWIPDLLFILCFEWLDSFRVYDAFLDQQISPGLYQFYRVCTFFESVTFIVLTQIFATSPFESVYVHSIPYLMFIIALWTLAMKRFVYLNQTGYFTEHLKNKWLKYAGLVYVVVLLFNVVVILTLLIPDLFGAGIHKHPKWQWTATLYQYNSNIHLITCNVIPVVVSIAIMPQMDVVEWVMNRKLIQKRSIYTTEDTNDGAAGDEVENSVGVGLLAEDVDSDAPIESMER